MAGIKDRRIITYGMVATADVRAINMRVDGASMAFDVQLSDRAAGDATIITDIRFPMLGDHNVQNCLAAIAVALEMNISPMPFVRLWPHLAVSAAGLKPKGQPWRDHH